MAWFRTVIAVVALSTLAACPAPHGASPPVQTPHLAGPVVTAQKPSGGAPAGEDQLEQIVRAHLGDADLRTCMSTSFEKEMLLRLRLEHRPAGIAFQSEALGSTHAVSNCINRLAYGWLPTGSDRAELRDAELTFVLINDTRSPTLGFVRVRTSGGGGTAMQALPPGSLELVAGRLGGPGDRDGSARSARFGLVLGIAADRTHVFVADARNRALRRIDRATGEVSTLLVAPASMFVHPTALAFDPEGWMYVLDALHGHVARVDADRLVPIYHGAHKAPNSIEGARAMVFSRDGMLYVADTARHRIVRIDLPTGTLTEVAGTRDHAGYRDGTDGLFAHPEGLAIDDAGEHLYVAEWTNHTIREITLASGRVRTLAGRAGVAAHADATAGAARFDGPSTVVYDHGALYVAESGGHVIRRVDVATGRVTTLAGRHATPGHADGIGAAARISHYADRNTGELPFGLARAPDSTLFLADSGNSVIRQIEPATGEVTTLAGLAGDHRGPRAITYGDDGALYATIGQAVYRLGSGGPALVAGDAEAMGHDDGTGTSARFRGPIEIAAAPDGSLVVLEINGQVRRVDPRTRAVRTVVDLQTVPEALAVDPRGTIYVGAVGAIVRIADDGKPRTVVLAPNLVPFRSAPDAVEVPLEHLSGLAVDGDVLFVLDDSVQTSPLDLVVTRLRRIDLATGSYDNLAIWLAPRRTHGSPRAGGLVLDRGALWIAHHDGSVSRFDPATRIEQIAIAAPASGARGVTLGPIPGLNAPSHPMLDPAGQLVLIDEAAVLRLRR